MYTDVQNQIMYVLGGPRPNSPTVSSKSVHNILSYTELKRHKVESYPQQM